MAEKLFIFKIGPNEYDFENYSLLQETISKDFPPEEFSTSVGPFYSVRKFWIGEEVFARANPIQPEANTEYQIGIKYLDERTAMPRDPNRTLGDFMSDIKKLPSFHQIVEIENGARH